MEHSTPPSCSEEGCEEPARRLGFCNIHYQRRRRRLKSGERSCKRCGKDIPPSLSGRRREYCDDECRKPKAEPKARQTSGTCAEPDCERYPNGARGYCRPCAEKRREAGEWADETCTKDGCDRITLALGFCRPHLLEGYASGEVAKAQCSVPDCPYPTTALGLCSAHYNRRRKGMDLAVPPRKRREGFTSCSVDGCDEKSWARQMCPMHYWRWRTRGDAGIPGKERPGGSRVVMSEGYVKIHVPDHPAAARDGYVMEHRLVMEYMIGRPLHWFETPHHRNGIRDDNSPSNLELWVKPQPAGQRVQDLVDFVVATYREYVEAALRGEPLLFPNEPTNVTPG